MPDTSPGPLSGVRILDLSRILAGPFCTQLLGDLGADVIKVERPGVGDDTRSWGPPFVERRDGQESDDSAYFLSANRNKRSIEVDISSRQGIALIKELLSTCDVLIENFKVGNLAKFGLSYADLKEEFPKLVYCSITGFGQTGPNTMRPGYDLLAQGFGGIMSLNGEPDGEPMKVAVGISDLMTGMYASTAILAALRHADKTGDGQQIDVCLVDVQTAWLVNQGNNYLMTGQLPKRLGNQHPGIVPYQVFEVADGHLIIAVGNDSQYRQFCKIVGQPELANNPKYARNQNRLENRDELIGILIPIIKQTNKIDLLSKMKAAGVPGGPINTLQEVFDSDQVQARNMKITMPHTSSATGQVDLIGNPLKLSKTPVSYRRAPPERGADTQEVLLELSDLQ